MIKNRISNFRKIFLIASLVVLLFALSTIVVDLFHNQKISSVRAKAKNVTKVSPNDLLRKLQRGESIELAEIENIKAFVDRRYDTSDFRLQSILRIMYEYPHRLSPKVKQAIKEMLMGFKYWMDEPGEDGMCFWSENHQILFAAAEYLAGQLFPDEVFTNNGMTGRKHQQKARKRILIWLKQRWLYGFTEWYSNVYYVEDIAPLSNLIDFADDEEIVTKSKIIMDLLVYDLASQSFKGSFVTSMGRSYEGGKKSGRNASTRAITEMLFGYDVDPGEHRGMDVNFLGLKNYQPPEVLRAIGRDTGTVVIKATNGLNLVELKHKGLIGLEDNQIMMQWAMEAFTNPEVIDNSLDFVNQHNMQRNEFLYNFRLVNYRLLRWLGLLGPLSKLLHAKTNGVAIQRANVYTYKTPQYSMYTAQSYHPGEYGDQHHVFGITLSNNLSIFHTHPALQPGDKPKFGSSPSYWVGYGRLPHSVQDENISLSIYNLPKRRGVMEKRLLDFTHLYCPQEEFDVFRLQANTLFLKYGQVFIAFICKNNLRYNAEQQDVIQPGREAYWICEMSTAAQETFAAFIARIEANSVRFKDQRLSYTSRGEKYELQFGGTFRINGRVIDTEYPRYDSSYIQSDREPEELRFQFQGHSLYLNFNKTIRR